MAKTVYNKRRNPVRDVKKSHPFATPRASLSVKNGVLIVEDLFETTPTNDEVYQKRCRQTSTSKVSVRQNNKKTAKPLVREEISTEDDDDEEVEATNYNQRHVLHKNATAEDDDDEDEDNDPEEELDQVEYESPREPHKKHKHQRNASVNSVSSTDSSEKRKVGRAKKPVDAKHKEQRVQTSASKYSKNDGHLEIYKQQLSISTEEKKRIQQENVDLLAEIRQLKLQQQPISQSIKKTSGKRQTLASKGKDNDSEFEPSDDDDEASQGDVASTDMVLEGMKAVKKTFRIFKFICTDSQEKQFCELVMDNYNVKNLIYDDTDTDEKKAEVLNTRKVFKKTYGKNWVSYLNRHRSYTQQRSRDFVMEWMEDMNLDKLPSPTLMRECILTRDFSRFAIGKEDSPEQQETKRKGMQMLEDLMDFYTDKLIPAHAGAKVFHPKIRHFQSMTTSVLQTRNGEVLRIPSSTEAMAVLTYINNHKKWEAMRRWKKANPGKNVHKCPRFSKNKPTENTDFKTEFSDICVGKAAWGGWSDDGKVMFVELQRESMDSRKEHLERHVNIDLECVARLYEKFKDLHASDERKPKKQKQNGVVRDESAFDFVLEP